METKKVIDIYKGRDPADIPAYTPLQVARYLDVPAATVRAWVFGRNYRTKEGVRYFEPVIKVPDVIEGVPSHQLSFTNLVEVHVLRAIRVNHDVPLEKVRLAVEFLETVLNADHPLARIDLQTDGLDLYIDNLEQIISVSRHGQMYFREVVKAHLRRIERGSERLARRLYPFTGGSDINSPSAVVIDPRISFGRPVLVGTGIPTAELAERFKAGESFVELAEDYGIDAMKIEEALRSELLLAS